MQYKVPQNIDLADKIFGPLTLFQFLYLLAGGMILYVFIKAQMIILAVLVGGPALLIALAFAFVKINNQPFSKFVFSFISYSLGEKKRLWRKGGQTTEPEIILTGETAKKQPAKTQRLNPADFAKLANVLDKISD